MNQVLGLGTCVSTLMSSEKSEDIKNKRIIFLIVIVAYMVLKPQ